MEAKTLKEVCELVGVTRRAVQGYEEAGLVTATGRNKYGHLLYDEASIERIREIKQYQNFGFTIKEIRMLQKLPKGKYLEMLENRLHLLQLEMRKLQGNIGALEQLIAEKR